MMLYKNVIITLVTVALFLSSGSTIHLIRICPHFRDDMTSPLLSSVFAAGLTQGIFGIMAMLISWFNLQHVQFLLQFSFWIMIVSGYAGYYSLACLSSVKLFAVMKPFVFQRKVSKCKVTITTVTIWIICGCAFSLVMFHPEIISFRPASQTPVFDFTQEMVSSLVWRVAVPLLYMPIILLLLTSSGLFVITIKQAIRIQLMKRRQFRNNNSDQVESQGQMTHVIMAALWSAKGVMVLSLVRLTIHLPFFLMESRQRDASNLVFYFQWGLLSGPIFDSICFIGCSKTLRKLIVLKLKCKCGYKIQPVTQSGIMEGHRKPASHTDQAELHVGHIEDQGNVAPSLEHPKPGFNQDQSNLEPCPNQPKPANFTRISVI